MSNEELIELLIEELEIESTELTLSTNFKELEEWGSMASMVLITISLEHYGKKITGQNVQELTDVQSFVDLLNS